MTMIATLLPAIQFCGLLNPVDSLEGAGALIGRVYPTTHFLTISRGVFSKALQMTDLYDSFRLLLLVLPVAFGAAVLLLKKQEH